MRAPRTWLACGVVVAGVGPWLPGFLTTARLDLWNFPAVVGQHDEHRRAGQVLDGDIGDVFRVAEAKEAILADLRAGRISLVAAADLYYRMLAEFPRVLAVLHIGYPEAASDEERAALRLVRQAIGGEDGPDRDALAARLDAEYREHFRPASLPTTVVARAD